MHAQPAHAGWALFCDSIHQDVRNDIESESANAFLFGDLIAKD